MSVEVVPKHFWLRPGESIRYTPVLRTIGGELQTAKSFEVESADPRILGVEDNSGLVRALAEGSTELVVRASGCQRTFQVEVSGPELEPIDAVHHTQVDAIRGSDVLFVGHANRDGFDHTAVAKAGIDEWVRAFKEAGKKVVYWVSEEYPNWYVDDREPDLAIISEGQEHEILVEAGRVVITGGDFMFCTIRNVQMALHAMIGSGTRDFVHYVFPPEAIWMSDIWKQRANRPYPEPMVRLSDLWARHDSDTGIYSAVVVPFVDRLLGEYPVLDYPSNPPTPDLMKLIDDWNVKVSVGDGLRRSYRETSSRRTIHLEFLKPRSSTGS